MNVQGILPGEISHGALGIIYRNVTVYAPAVADTGDGYVGVISTITVTIQSNGSGRVFADTLPLTEIDMQGSARLAVKVASALVSNDKTITVDPDEYDYFFVVRTEAPIIGGPSAGAVMTTAAIALLENWTIDSKTVMTGMINPDGSIGPIGGIPQKIDAAYSVGATRFLFPKGQGTYTEMITETIKQNGWTQTYTHPITRNVSDYARRYGMEVVEVEDVNDALLYLTGHTFSTPTFDDDIITEHYVASMEPLASNLLSEATRSFENASQEFNDSNIPNRYPFYYRNQITDILNAAETNLDDAQSWYDHEMYYTTTSKSFQSLIDSRFVSYACGYFLAEDDHTYLQDLLVQAQQLFENKSAEAKNAVITGIISLQCVGAAQERVSEAEDYIAGAQTDYNNNDYLTALYKIAFAVQRSESVGWWLRIASYYNETGNITNTMLENLAEEYIEDAQQSITYSTVIVQDIGTTSTYLSDANTLLVSAQEDRDAGYPAAAFFEALEALVKGNLALELVDGMTQDKLIRAEENARLSIGESRAEHIEPVLALSYYEYAQSLQNESSFDTALVYYKYSDLIAGALQFTSVSESRSSRFIGIPAVVRPTWYPELVLFSASSVFFFVLGSIAGLGIGLILWGLSSKKEKNRFFSERWIPRSIEDYYKKHK